MGNEGVCPQEMMGGGPSVSMEDIEDAETITCEKCKSVVFHHGFVIKKTSALSKVGEQVFEIPIVYCAMCGTPVKDSCPITL